MKNMNKLIITLCGYLYSNKTSAAAIAGVVPVLPAMALGEDPLPWMIGGGGGVFVYLMREPVNRKRAAASVMFSIVLGGVAAPTLALTLIEYFQLSKATGIHYLVALMLGWGWPWLIEDGWPVLRGIVSKGGQ